MDHFVPLTAKVACTQQAFLSDHRSRAFLLVEAASSMPELEMRRNGRWGIGTSHPAGSFLHKGGLSSSELILIPYNLDDRLSLVCKHTGTT